MTDTHDVEIIDRILSGDIESYAVLIDRYNDKVFRYMYSRVFNYDEARDMTQDVFMMAYESLALFRRESKFYTWLFSIAVNYCKNYRKRASRYNFIPIQRSGDAEGYEIQIRDERQNVEESVINSDSLDIIKEELHRLPDEYRDILLLRDIEGLSYNEIVRILKINLSNVKVRIHRGRELLKKRLEERGLV